MVAPNLALIPMLIPQDVWISEGPSSEEYIVVPNPCEDFPTGFTLSFNGVAIGTRVLGYKPLFKRVTGVNVRQNLWASTAIMDGAYPSVVWEHEFRIFDEKASLTSYADIFATLSTTHITSDPQELKVINEDLVVDAINYGNCYMLSASQTTPDEILQYEAGVYSVKFQGVTVPVRLT